MTQILALAASQPHGKFEKFTYDPGPLGDEQVEIEVQYCGVCHSDLSMWGNEWGMTQYPFVPGHEAIGRVVAMGAAEAATQGYWLIAPLPQWRQKKVRALVEMLTAT